jgi:TolB-like protein/tetratricopeptide (TPR) repeat protein
LWSADVQFLFEDYALDIDRRELRRGAKLISIGPQVFDLLVYLVKNRERVVTKDDLLDAVWHGRIVSESTLTSHINAVRKAVGDSGEKQRLIRTVARKGFRFLGDVREARTSDDGSSTKLALPIRHDDPKHAPALPIPDKPSIAVLPFQNMSGDPEQDYFADGMVEEIITALSRMHWLFVIARNSSFTYKGRSVDVKQVGRELGVRYVLEGGVRKVANRVRITGQLIDAATGVHLWADRFEGSLEDIFDLQDQVTASVVGVIAPKLEQAEIERAKRKPTESLDAYDYYLRAMASLYQWTRESNDEALRLFYRAIELDPNFASAYGVAAWCYVWRKTQGWAADGTQEAAEATRLARRAVELGKDDAVALSAGSYALAHIAGDLNGGAAFIERALVLNPNLAGTWLNSGWVRIWLGESEVAIEHLARAMRLSPLDPILFRMQGATASAHFFAGRYDEASSWAEKALRENPNQQALRTAAASHALAGRLEEAQKAVARMRQLDPDFRISNLKDRLPAFRRPQDFARYAEGLRKAGLPE